MGRPTAATPARNQGARKPIVKAPQPCWLLAAGYWLLFASQLPLPNSQILAQRVIEGPAGVDLKIVDARGLRARLDIFDVRLNLRRIFVGYIIGRDFEGVACFQIFKQYWMF